MQLYSAQIVEKDESQCQREEEKVYFKNFLLNLKEGDFIRRGENFCSDIRVKPLIPRNSIADKMEGFNISDS